MVAPLAGDYAPYGQQVRKGIELALDKLKSEGINTEIFYEDACLPMEVHTAVNKLAYTDKINALVGSYCVIGMVASKSILEKEKIISFQTSGGTNDILNPEEFLFTTSSRTKDEAAKLAEYAFNKLHFKRVGTLYLETQWGEEISATFIKRFEELGGVITGKAANRIGETNFSAEITKLRVGKPYALLMVHLGGVLGTAIVQARDFGFKNQILVTSDAEDNSVTDFAKGKAEGIKFITPETFEDNIAVKQFKIDYHSKYNEEPTHVAQYAYDGTMLATKALKKCNLNPDCTKDEIYRTKDYQGASGEFSIDPDGGTTRNFIEKMVKNGEFVGVEKQ